MTTTDVGTLDSPSRARRLPRLRTLLAAAAVVAVAVELVLAAPSIAAAVADLSGARLWWVGAALALEAASFVAFALVKRALLIGTGTRLPTHDVLTGVLVSNAVYSTAPAGIALSTAYDFRWARSRGISPAATTWQLAAGGVLSTITLAAVTATGALVLGTGMSTTSIPLAAAPVVALIVASRWLTTRGDTLVAALAGWLRGRTRLRRHQRWGRLVDTVTDAMEHGAGDLSTVAPRASTWLAAAAYSLLNWVLDIATLAVCLIATGVSVPAVGALVLAYAAAMAASNFSLLPFGIGTTDLALIAALVAAGCDAHSVLPAVVLYRLVSTGAPTVAGWALGARQLRHRPVST
ncbi:MAG: UPF0104 family protein [Pseudonocardia sp.]|uniref:lysylphosphatidylglycerol synthase transmembrane domain-containing protein n=1 Tax=unclassified Pseudonocardia TaxID=2619320 RepID=UPI00086B9D3F|nr:MULTISPECIES: YbhN family protein [unclassified Pseudonocardia]MBN9113685.1 UPF0104 family protein [Pseudonocardia sp.]ODU28051.1 MAG: hypothetical protein ABS80_02885 [Pseudonocardia sp. SCN 72-51]